MPIKVPKIWKDIRLAHEAVQLEHLQGVHKSVDRLVRKQQDGTLGEPDNANDNANDEGEGMGVSVGNTTTNNYPVSGGNKKSTFLSRAAWAAVLMAAGGGSVALVPLALEAIQALRPSPVVFSPDANTLFELDGSGE